MDPLFIALILFAVGVALVAAELVLPGGVLGGAGAVAIGGGVVACFFHSSTAGAMAMGGVILLGPLAGWLWVNNLHRTPGARRIVLGPNDTSGVAPTPQVALRVGMAGMTISELRPGGVAEFDDERVQVQSEAGVIPAGTPIRVVACADGRATVRRL